MKKFFIAILVISVFFIPGGASSYEGKNEKLMDELVSPKIDSLEKRVKNLEEQLSLLGEKNQDLESIVLKIIKLDSVFEEYAHCFCFNKEFLFLLAIAESGLQEDLQVGTHCGLFQITQSQCFQEMENKCKNSIFKPEINTYNALAWLEVILTSIERHKHGPKMTEKDQMAALYLGWHKGSSILSKMLDSGAYTDSDMKEYLSKYDSEKGTTHLKAYEFGKKNIVDRLDKNASIRVFTPDCGGSCFPIMEN
jgi:hypothetical protein